MKRTPTREEVDRWVKLYFCGQDARTIGAGEGWPPGVVNTALKKRGAYNFQRRKTEPP